MYFQKQNTSHWSKIMYLFVDKLFSFGTNNKKRNHGQKHISQLTQSMIFNVTCNYTEQINLLNRKLLCWRGGIPSSTGTEQTKTNKQTNKKRSLLVLEITFRGRRRRNHKHTNKLINIVLVENPILKLRIQHMMKKNIFSVKPIKSWDKNKCRKWNKQKLRLKSRRCNEQAKWRQSPHSHNTRKN